MKKQKVLIVIGDAGGGHKRPAQAMQQIFEEKYSDKFKVEIIDLFTEADVAPFNSSDSSYELVSQNYTLTAFSNFWFRVFNTDIGYFFFKEYVLWRLFKETRKIIEKRNPDIVVANNPMVALILREMKERLGGFKYAVQVTDLGLMQRCFADPSAELVITPSKSASDFVMRYGVKRSRIKEDLFPIRPTLQDYRPKSKVLKELGFDPKKKTILVTGGGFGTNKYLLKALDKAVENREWQFIILAGKVRKIKSFLEHKYVRNGRIAVLGFVDNIQDYHNAVDLLVGKPGTSTILECEAFGNKAVFTRRVGEQEVGNVKYLLENPLFRYLGDDWDKMTDYIKELLELDVKGLKNVRRRSFTEVEEIVDVIVEQFGT